MARFAPASLELDVLQQDVMSTYSRVAEDPEGDFHFHRGAQYAASALQYDAEELALLPSGSTAAFAGVANPLLNAEIVPGETVLDIGCGGGMDLLFAARRTGPKGRAIGVDITEAMRLRASKSAAALGLNQVEILEGDALSLPVEDQSVDLVISNGVLNLTPNKLRAFREIARVLKPGGRLSLADIAIGKELSLDTREDIDLWSS